MNKICTFLTPKSPEEAIREKVIVARLELPREVSWRDTTTIFHRYLFPW